MKQLEIPGPAGRLECLLQQPEADPPAVAVVAHPHPLHGGTMDNAVVAVTAQELAQEGLTVLRFNFRGVGHSDGEHTGGEGETGDLHAAARWLQRRHPQLPLWLAGYSFGAATILRLPARTEADAVLLLAPPLSMQSFEDAPFAERLAAGEGPPVAIVYGERDELTGEPHREAWQPWRPSTYSIPGAGHDLGVGEPAHLRAALEAALDSLGVRSRRAGPDGNGSPRD